MDTYDETFNNLSTMLSDYAWNTQEKEFPDLFPSARKFNADGMFGLMADYVSQTGRQRFVLGYSTDLNTLLLVPQAKGDYRQLADLINDMMTGKNGLFDASMKIINPANPGDVMRYSWDVSLVDLLKCYD